jgi:adenylate cyclase
VVRKIDSSVLALGGLLVLAATLAWLAVNEVAPLRQAEAWLGDVGFAYLAVPRPQQSDVIVLAINEDTLAGLAFRSPVSRRFLAELLEELGHRSVAAVGIDVIFDQPTLAVDDQALLDAVDAFPAPVVLAYAPPGTGLTDRQREFQARYVANRNFGSVSLFMTDGVVRTFYPYDPGDADLRSFPAALAAARGVSVPATPQRLYFQAVAEGGAPAIRKYPAHQLELLPRSWFEGATVLIGADMPNQDRFRTPLSVLGARQSTMPGVEVHAQALTQLLEGSSAPALAPWGTVLLLLAAAGLGVLLPLAPVHVTVKAVVGVAAAMAYPAAAFATLAAGGPPLPLLAPTLAFLLGTAFSSAYERRQERAQKRFLKTAFQHYVSPAIIDDVVNNPEKLALGGEEREMSFVFSDLGGFTTLTEQLTPPATVSLLQEYFRGMLAIALELGGTVDRMIGDSILVFFGAPVDQPDHVRRAVLCALEWDEYCERFRREQRARGVPFGVTRIGVHTGLAVVGNVGTTERFQYTAHGDCVNTASRLESVNKHFGTRACLSAEAARHYPEAAFRPVGHLILKGKTEGLDCVTVGHDLSADELEEYRAAYALMHADDPRSVRRFAELFRKLPHDALVAFHAARLQRGETGSIIVLGEK